MRAHETSLNKFFDGNKQFIIPIYQRAYNWTQEEAKQLWEDIIKVGKDESISAHFIGSVVYIEEGISPTSMVQKLLVIDGQQRLTTLSLLLAALSKAMSEEQSVEGMNSKKLKNYYLLNSDEEGELRYKLELTKNDKKTLFKIVDDKGLTGDDAQRLRDNYLFFVEQISKNDIKNVYKGILKLMLIDVPLERGKDNPQLIFESLNSTGLELTQADLIRNYILMDLKKEEQDDLYKNYWQPMEESFGYANYSELFNRFMRDYLTLKTGKIPNIKHVYSVFKSHAQKLKNEDSKNIRHLVSDISKYSKYFINIERLKEPEIEIRKVFEDINSLRVDVSYPFLLAVYDDYKEGIISKEALIDSLKCVESYIFRRAVCGIPTNALNKIFANLRNKIKVEKYLESFKAVFLIEKNMKCPTDAEFKREFMIKDMYNFRPRIYLLRKLENYGRKELVNVEEYTIEHIMPRTLSSIWENELGENRVEVHEKYLHTIGNLTLTGYNPELSNKSFKEKKEIEGGFADSPIKLNEDLAKLEHWSEKEINRRAESLSEKAVQIWAGPQLSENVLSDYKSAESKVEDDYSLEDYKYLLESEPMRPLFDKLRKRIFNIDSQVEEEFRKSFIMYKTTDIFVSIFPQRNNLKLRLSMKFEEIDDPKGSCRDISDTGNWGNREVEFKVSEFDELDYAIFLIKQALEKVSGE